MGSQKTIKLGSKSIGGDSSILVQSMLSCDTLNKDAVFYQIDALINEGCDVIRLAIENEEAIKTSKEYLNYSSVPLVADVHFDYKLAIKCSEIGFSKIRVNPGNISRDKLKNIITSCKANGTAIRLGVNGGSLEKNLIKTYGVNAKSLAISALENIKIFESLDFENLIVSIKSSCVKTTVMANRLLSQSCPYPLHIGITESGFGEDGIMKSAIGIGAMLLDGIGDTIRVSLTGDPIEEVKAGKEILKALNLINYVEVVSCPTCSRCKFDLLKVAKEVKELTKGIKKKMKIAVMGCVVNGPGEAMDADLGVAGGGDGMAVIFKKGRIIKTVAFDKIIETLNEELFRKI
ncbi:MAG: flavodoxin-dependent (E)-4-hydroxy-3-methylbut-2-enyl-diphosphate synthase [Firmicutes bacterium]|nr:flavodoxin-dependent (E)-4-hydroxy-3-methylbut-2-enyl-diphosphate synthase [Bacillota bacterium]